MILALREQHDGQALGADVALVLSRHEGDGAAAVARDNDSVGDGGKRDDGRARHFRRDAVAQQLAPGIHAIHAQRDPRQKAAALGIVGAVGGPFAPVEGGGGRTGQAAIGRRKAQQGVARLRQGGQGALLAFGFARVAPECADQQAGRAQAQHGHQQQQGGAALATKLAMKLTMRLARRHGGASVTVPLAGS
ncbi:hypothetical protein D3C85_1059050 [compost metagenome]